MWEHPKKQTTSQNNNEQQDKKTQLELFMDPENHSIQKWKSPKMCLKIVEDRYNMKMEM